MKVIRILFLLNNSSSFLADFGFGGRWPFGTTTTVVPWVSPGSLIRRLIFQKEKSDEYL